MLAFKSLERASLASLCTEADRLAVSKDGTRFEILVRVAAKQRPDLIAAAKSEQQGAEPVCAAVDGPGKAAVPILDLQLDEAEDVLKAEVEKRLSSADANKQNALVGAFVRDRMPESFSCWLKEQLLQDIRSGSASPVKKETRPRHARAPVWDHLQSMMIRSMFTAQSAARQRRTRACGTGKAF